MNYKPASTSNRKLVISITISLLLGISAGGMYWLANRPTPSHAININPLPTTNPRVAGLTDDYIASQSSTVQALFLGYGGPGHDGGQLTDVIILTKINPSEKSFEIITIPRDIWLTFPNNEQGKLNSAYAKDNPPDFTVTKNAVSTITGLPIDYVAAIDFVGFQRAVGGPPIDGIEVNVSKALDDPWYPIRGEELNPCGHTPEKISQMTQTLSGFNLEKQFPCRYEHIDIKPGLVTMRGHEALAYVRSRHSSSDFDRSRRQQEIIAAIKDKLFSLDALANIPEIYQALSQHLTTDISLDIVETLAPMLTSLKEVEITNINLSTQNVLTTSKSNTGAFILIPKAGINQWDKVHDFINGKTHKIN